MNGGGRRRQIRAGKPERRAMLGSLPPRREKKKHLHFPEEEKEKVPRSPERFGGKQRNAGGRKREEIGKDYFSFSLSHTLSLSVSPSIPLFLTHSPAHTSHTPHSHTHISTPLSRWPPRGRPKGGREQQKKNPTQQQQLILKRLNE